MRYASIGKQPRREVNIPELSGGMNLRDSVSMIKDNQLTECQNMWFKDGMLRTRPSFKALKDTITVPRITSQREILGVKKFPDITNGDMVLASLAKMEGEYETVYFWWQGENKKIDLYTTSPEADGQHKYFVVEKDGVLYCYFSDGTISKLNYQNGETSWSAISEADMYAPIVYHHCSVDASNGNFSGTQFEAYNLVGNRYRVIYSTVNPSSFVNGITEVKMKYPLPGSENTNRFDGKVIIAEITYENKVVEHKVVFQNGNNRAYEEKPNIGDGLIMCATNYEIWFEVIYYEGTDNEYTEVKTLTAGDYIEDNLEITISYQTSLEEKIKVFGMTDSVWFGGAASGIGGGSRLFLCGNTNEKEQALVVWSGLNNPLYFPKNNYAYVGNKAQPTTAFGKQGENLIIFKPNETHYSYYVQNTNITADDLINQSVVDYQANSVYFPMVTLHSSIGCDCPDTVQLCRNRLVWANSDGKVYTLVSANQYSEMTIYLVSEMIERKIKEAGYSAEQLMAASSHDFDGHYILMIGSDAYVMDYNSYGYSHVYSYSKTEDANTLIPWYYWKLLPEGIATRDMDTKPQYYGFGDFIAGTYYLEGEDSQGSKICTCIMKVDNADIKDKYMKLDDADNPVEKEASITSSLQTKLFDFSAPNYYKNVDRVSLMLGNNGGAPISVQFVTDAGCEQETVTLTDSELTPFTAGYVSVQSFNPCVRSVQRFGVRLESEGLLAVDGINLLYRLLGGVR